MLCIGLSMSVVNVENALYVNRAYRLCSLEPANQQYRDYLISLGFVPGEIIVVVKKLFFGWYWVVRVHGQLVGLRWSEIKMLRLYGIEGH